VLLAVSTSIALLLSEGLARLVLDPADFLHATLVDDPVLNHRIEPSTTGHDELGFRNRRIPERAGIVAIGDSMTYGVGAPRDASWPHQLGELLGEPVYNMGLGGYGPLQYLHLARQAADTFKPRVLVVGFYFGNDMMDAFYLSRDKPHWHGWRVSVATDKALTDYDLAGKAEPKKRFAALRDWLSRNSVLYSILRVTVFPRFQAREQDALARQASPDVRMLWDDPALRTIFGPRSRLSAVDLDIRAVREGMQISQRALSALHADASRQGIRVLTILIPTKERAYCGQLARAGTSLPEAFAKLCEAEKRANAEMVRFLRAEGIEHLDVLPALDEQMGRGVAVYPPDADGHPQRAGYAVIAAQNAAVVRRQPGRKPSP
jgi:lysophospholipase L1-like esterase